MKIFYSLPTLEFIFTPVKKLQFHISQVECRIVLVVRLKLRSHVCAQGRCFVCRPHLDAHAADD